MRSPRQVFALMALVLALLPGRATAQELFNFPQTHDTTFGDGLFLGPFFWYADGQGARGRRVASNIEVLDAMGFNLLMELSCIAAGTTVALDVYVNDRQVGSVPLPSDISPCNSVPAPVSGAFDFASNPIAGLGGGKEFEIRFQLRGTALVHPGGLWVFYKIDTSNSTIALAGHMGGGDGGGGGDDGGGGGGGGGTVDNSEVLGRIGQAESNLLNDGGSTRTAVQSVRDALGIVEGNVKASIAGAVLKVNAETALGIDRLAVQLGVQTQDLALAVQGNKSAIANIQKSIEEKLMPEALKINSNVLAGNAKMEDLGNNFFETTLSTALAAGTGILSLWSGGALLPVANFLQKSIQQVITGNLRPDRIVNKAIAEFNRGLKRVKKIFHARAVFDLPWDRKELEAITFGMAEEGPGLDPITLPEVDDHFLGPDKEEDNAFGAFVWFSRSYQTLTRREGPPWGRPWCGVPGHQYLDNEHDDWEHERAAWAKEKAELEKKIKK